MKSASEIVGEAIGAASMCWSETPKGVFDSSRALVLLEEIMTAITEAVLAEREACAQLVATSTSVPYEIGQFISNDIIRARTHVKGDGK